MNYTEGNLKVKIAKYLIEKKGAINKTLATEVKYGFSRRRADFIMVDNFSHAFEIKSDFDNTLRLQEQLDEYSLTFDFVSVLTTERHLGKVRSIANRKIGLLIPYENGILQVRKAQQNKALSKFHLASSISKTSLIKELPELKSKQSLEEVTHQSIEILTINRLREIFLEELRRRFDTTSKIFFEEIDNEINEEDLLFLKKASHLSF